MFKKCRYIFLGSRQKHTVPAIKELGKCFQITVVGFTGEWTQPLFHTQVCLVVLQEREIAYAVHTLDYPRVGDVQTGVARDAVPRSSRNQLH
jgi:hypothetical protein